MLEVLDHAYHKLKDPKDILMVDLDDKGAVKIMTKEKIDQLVKEL